MAATFTHMLLWNRKDIESAWSWMSPGNLKRMWANRRSFDWKIWSHDGSRLRELEDATETDPHYREMLKYPDAPNSWYATVFICSCIVALVVIYKTDSTLPWYVSHPHPFVRLALQYINHSQFRWGFLVALALGSFSVLFYGALYAITGLSLSIQPFVQMISGFIFPGKPMANMYFVVFSYSVWFTSSPSLITNALLRLCYPG